MSEVELLREAAKVMRERANAATAGPWDHGGGDGLVWPRRVGDPVSGSTELADAEHIASWQPAVALAVADWLDCEAEHVDELGLSAHEAARWIDGHALAVARVYLGRQP